MSKVLLIDGTSTFIRCYSAVASMDINGVSNGGVVGTLSSLNFIINQCAPDKVIFVWDGIGGSKKRRSLLKDYKAQRKPTRLNRNFDHELIDTEKNKEDQRIRIHEYLNDLPIWKLEIDDIEADDTIAYLVKVFEKDNITIASTDKDFYQLVGDKVNMFNTAKKMFVTKDDVLQKFNISTKNFTLARSMAGDDSDNIEGVRGVGLKTAVKLFPFLSEDNEYDLDHLFEFARTSKDKKYDKIIFNEERIRLNFKVMNLKEMIISYHSINKINESLKEAKHFNSTAFRLKLMEDGITSFGDGFFRTFRILNIKEE